MNNVTPLPNPCLRPISAIVQNIVSAVSSRRDTAKAYEHAATFCEAIATLLRTDDEMAEARSNLARYLESKNLRSMVPDERAFIAELETRYAKEFGELSVALLRLPVKWHALLGADFPNAETMKMVAE